MLHFDHPLLPILALFAAVVAWGRFRTDLVALVALLLAVWAGVVPAGAAFDGFADPALPVLAALFVLGSAVRASGAVDLVVSWLRVLTRWATLRMLALSLLGAAMAALSGNGPVLTSLVHDAVRSFRQKREQILSLRLPIAVLTTLGGLLTVVGTTPNLLVTSLLPGQFGFGDFAAVGAPVLLAGTLVLIATWRLLPRDQAVAGSVGGLAQVEFYVSEVLLPAGSPLVGQTVRGLEARSEGAVAVKGIVREEFRRIAPRPDWTLEAGDVLVLACEPAVLQRLLERAGLSIVGGSGAGRSDGERVGVVEAIVTPASDLIGASPGAGGMQRRGVNLLAIGRSGREPTGRLHRTKLQAGDVLMLQGELAAMPAILSGLGCLALSERRLRFGRRQMMLAPLAVLVIALAIAGLGAVPLALSLLGAVLVLVLIRSVTLDEAYAAVPWPLLLLIGALLPLAVAARDDGAAEAAARFAGPLLAALPASILPILLLALALGCVALLGSAPAALLLLPFVPAFAQNCGLRPEALAAAVALGASCSLVRRSSTNMLGLPMASERQPQAWRVLMPLYATILVVGGAAILHAWPLR